MVTVGSWCNNTSNVPAEISVKLFLMILNKNTWHYFSIECSTMYRFSKYICCIRCHYIENSLYQKKWIYLFYQMPVYWEFIISVVSYVFILRIHYIRNSTKIGSQHFEELPNKWLYIFRRNLELPNTNQWILSFAFGICGG